MASWAEFEAEAPELAARVRALLDAHPHKTLATLRLDGSPRISGTEAEVEDGELWTTVGHNAERTALVIEVWTPGNGVRTMNRA